MHYCAKVLVFLRKAARRRSAEEISRKVRKVRKVMIGITLATEAIENLFRRIVRLTCGFADILSAQENLSRKERKERKEMEGGNGATIGSAVTLCSNHAYQSDAVENLPGSRTKSAKEISREVRKFINWRPLAAEASKNLLNVESPSDSLDRGCLSRRRKYFVRRKKSELILKGAINFGLRK